MPHRQAARALLTAVLLGLGAARVGGAGPVPVKLIRHEVLRLAPDDLRVDTHDGLAQIRLRGGVSAGAPGSAALPAVPVTLLLPEGFSPGQVRLVVAGSRRLDGIFALTARPGPPIDPGDGAREPPAPPCAVTSLPEAPTVQLGPVGYRRGQRVITLLVTPFRKSSVGQIEFITDLELEIELVASAGGGAAVREEPFLPLRQAPVRISGGQPFQPTFRPSLDGTPVACVIITDDAQAAVYQQLANWKTRTGVPAVVRTVDWIRANYPNGVDTPETIRNFIRDAAQKWGTQWVVLGGDTPVVPIRSGRSRYYSTEDIPTDLYYQCLDGTWNADGDALFGEGFRYDTDPGDDCDLYSDVFVGRLPTQNPAEAQVVIDKILAYVRTPIRDGSLTRILALGEVLFPDNYHPGDSIQLDGGTICETAVAAIHPAWRATRLYEHCPAPAFPDCILERKSTVIDSLNAGFGIVHHVGHGFTNTMSVGDQGLTLTNADADALTNGPRTFLLYAINCTSSAVDYSCIAERFILNPTGGAVASIGSTRFDYPLTSWEFQNEFYRLLFTEPGAELGRLADESRLTFIPLSVQDTAPRWTQFSQVLLGDPGMPVWTDEPVDLTVIAPTTHVLGASRPVVAVFHGGQPVEGARVCFEKPGDDYAVALTDLSGEVRVPFEPDDSGPYTMCVTAANAVPWIGTGQVVSGPPPRLFVSATEVLDDGSAGSSGNGDGRADAGETLALRLTLANSGRATTDSVTVTLGAFFPGLLILDPSTGAGPIDSAGTSGPLAPVLVRLAPTLTDRTEIPVAVGFSNDGLSGADTFVLRIHAPLLEWYRQWARDSVGTGNDDGIFAPGEPIALRGVLRNTGLGSSSGLVARLTTADSTIIVTDSVMVVGTLPGGVATPVLPADGLEFVLTDTTGVADGLRTLEVRLYDQNGGPVPRGLFRVGPPGRLPAPAGLLATGEPGGVALTITPVSGSGVRGYNIYRATGPAGSFSRINPFVTERTAWYRDEGLTPYVVFSYQVAAQDSFGNEGPRSAVASASTTLPDRSGFPILTRAAANGSVTLAQLDGTPGLELLGAGEEIYALRHDATELRDGDGDPATIGALTDTGTGPYWNAPAVGDVDGDGSPEIAAVSWTGALYLWSAEGQVRPGFPRNVNLQSLPSPNPLGSVAMADLDGDLDLELVLLVGANILAFHHTGAEVLDGDGNPTTIGLFKSTTTSYSYGTPALADLTGDGRPEIICGMRDGKVHVFQATNSSLELPGFPVATGGNITSSPAVGDLDGDGSPEIVVGSSSNALLVLRADGTQLAGWPQPIQLQQDLDSSPALGDLTGDGRPDVVCGASNGRLFAWRHDGVALPGFPILIKDRLGQPVPIRSSPCLADLDADGSPEILIADQVGRLHAFRTDATPVPGFPVVTENKIDGGPAVWDLDGDGLTEIVVQSFDQQIHVWDTPWVFNRLASPWPMFHHDERHTGNLAQPLGAVAAVGGRPDEGLPTLRLEAATPNPFHGRTVFAFAVGQASAGLVGLPQPVRLEIFTAAGQSVRLLHHEPLAPGRYSLEWDGCRANGRPVAAGVYLVRLTTPAGSVAHKVVRLAR